jgi:hypothetical protein
VFGHAEVYGPFPPWIIARHEEIKRFIISAINANPSLVAVPEPPIAGSTLRTDFRVTSHSGATEYDLSVISLSAVKHSKSALRSLQHLSSFDSPLPLPDRVKASIQQTLSSAAEIKINKYTPILTVPFPPLLMPLGGMMEKSAVVQMERWKAEIGESSYWFLMRRMSVCLLRARAKVWRFE